MAQETRRADGTGDAVALATALWRRVAHADRAADARAALAALDELRALGDAATVAAFAARRATRRPSAAAPPLQQCHHDGRAPRAAAAPPSPVPPVAGAPWGDLPAERDLCPDCHRFLCDRYCEVVRCARGRGRVSESSF